MGRWHIEAAAVPATLIFQVTIEDTSGPSHRREGMAQTAITMRQAVVRFIRRPILFCVPVITLAIGIAPNIAVFAAVRAVLLDEMPYPHADRIASVARMRP